MPSMPGISTSSVSTSGLSALIFSRAISGLTAAPTTSMAGSSARMADSNWRMSAESSTTSTLIFPCPVMSSAPAAHGRVRTT